MKKIIVVNFSDPKNPDNEPDYMLTPRQISFVNMLGGQIAEYLKRAKVRTIKIISSSFCTSMHASSLIAHCLKDFTILSKEEHPRYDIIYDELIMPNDENYLQGLKVKAKYRLNVVDAVILVPSQKLVRPFLETCFNDLKPFHAQIEVGMATAIDTETDKLEEIHWFPEELMKKGGDLAGYFVQQVGETEGDICQKQSLDAWLGAEIVKFKGLYLLSKGMKDEYKAFCEKVEINVHKEVYKATGFKSLQLSGL